MKYAQVIILKKAGEFDSELTYKIPDELISSVKAGSAVRVPFRSRRNLAIVTGLTSAIPGDLSSDKIRAIESVLIKALLSPKQIDLCRFMSSYYHSSMTRVLRLMLPKLVWNGDIKEPAETFYRLIDREATVKGVKQQLVLDVLEKHQAVCSAGQLKSEIEMLTSQTLNTLLKSKILERFDEPLYENLDVKTLKFPEFEFELKDFQNRALKTIDKSDVPILLHGVTGSGKTEIYLRAIVKAIKNGKQAILLVPEISLTPQMIAYFRKYLDGHISVFHSKLSDRQRANEWWKVKSGASRLVIGSRSAIFAPVTDLGLVIMDEEHEWTYKQESSPYYQTHHVAEKLCSLFKSGLILGTATPSADSYHKAKQGIYNLFHLPDRIHSQDLPEIEVVDLRDEFKKRNFSVFSLSLQQKIKERLERKEQIILFVNQRGLANAVTCRECGYTEECPHCDISLKYHRHYRYSTMKQLSSGEDQLVCHYCTYKKSPELLCPECGSPYIKHIGVGTQRVEEEMHRLFPHARTVRADSDTTTGKDGFSPIYESFLNHDQDVLIGTQMIAKGLDFKRVSVIGIVLADIGRHRPDFRSSERLFQLITQVAGRCGRGEAKGEVVLQTYNPDHPTISKAADYQYNDFIETELKHRSKLSYPPFNRMIKFTVVGSDCEKLSEHIQQEKEVMEDIFKVNSLPVKIVSAPALIPKMANRYYQHVLIRSENPNIIFNHWKPPRGWRVDVDPINTT
jgi:primosomal protein N' (replication factor Y)